MYCKINTSPDRAAGGIRTPVGLPPNGFQDRLVMTTSIPLQIYLYCISVERNKDTTFSALFQEPDVFVFAGQF